MEINDIVDKLGFELENEKGLSGNNGTAYFLKGGKVLKITKHEEEIRAAKCILGKKNEYLADVYEIHEFDGFTVIISERLGKVSDNIRTSWDRYQAFYRFWFVLNLFYNLITLILTLKKRALPIEWLSTKLKAKNAIKWTEMDYRIAHNAFNCGISHPADYLDIDNMGMKNGHLASFDVLYLD